ncbi:MAG: uroporphyrinogen III synthase HEM4 [Alphaproteobacteria bacterium]|nr:uroporphyrinogen III synthase HEM4 [Alphaproteobacteria bacterium]
MMSDKNEAALENAEEIIERFGGIRPMANKMRVPVTTVQGWKKRNVIPGNRRDEIIQAAADNGIDLSGVLEAANENGREAVPPAGSASADEYSYEPGAQYESDDYSDDEDYTESEPVILTSESVREKEPAASAPRRRPAPDSQHEELLARMSGLERKAVRRSAWVASVLVALAISGGAFIMWPTAQKVDSHGRKISNLETDVARMDGRIDEVEEKQGRFAGLLPEGFNLGALQEQAKNLQETVGALVDTADEVSRTFSVEEPGSLGERVRRLEQQMDAIAGTPQFTELLARVEEFKQSVEGQETLNTSLNQLNALVEGMQGRMDQFDEALVVAREESDALGQTFEGVSNEDLKAAAMLVTLTKLRETLNRGDQPFAGDLELLQNLVGDDNPELQVALEKLAPHAEEGVLTPEGLSKEFRSFAGDIVVSSLKGEDVSVQEKAKARVNEILKVEKDGELLTGTDTQAKVARAESKLEQGDLIGAITELQSLEGAAAEAALPFMDKAQATLQAEQAKAMINSFVRQATSGMGSNAAYTTKMKGFSSLVPQSGGIVRDEESGVTVLTPAPKLPRN